MKHFGLRILVLGAISILSTFVFFEKTVESQTPETDISSQALSIEEQLRCPVCANEKLSTCSLAICNDMKQSIREQLAAGRSADEVILYFVESYGEEIRVSLGLGGVNLLLWMWTGASIIFPLAIGYTLLFRLKRTQR